MIAFTVSEIILSLISATIYGISFAILLRLLAEIVPFVRCVLLFPKEVFFYKGSIREIKRCEGRTGTPKGRFDVSKIFDGIYVTAAVFLFFFGFILISYAFLDGEIRLYMLIASLSCTFLAKKTVVDYFFTALGRCLFFVYSLLLMVCRIAVFPLRRLALLLKRLFLNFEKEIYKKIPNKPMLSLDTKCSK